MADIHLNTKKDAHLEIGKTARTSVGLNDTTMPKYVGARAVVDRLPEGVRITLTDYKGTTQEIIAEAISDITSNADGSLTITLPSGRSFTTASLTGPEGAQGEQGEAGIGIESAELNDDYTLTLTFTDGSTYTTSSIRGEQGLQGIQGERGLQGERGEKGDTGDTGVAGNGIASITKTGTSGLVDTYTILFTDGTTTTFTVTNGANGSGSVADVWVDGASVLDGDTAKIDLTGKADASDIPTKVSDLTNDSGFITDYTETDPVFLASAAHGISSTDISNWNNKSDFSGSYNDLTNKPTIPSAVTESTVSGWGFTKNTGTYSKPSGGIPKTDLATAVQTSLGKADTALQSFTETDPTVPSWAKAASKPSYTASEVGAVPTTRTVNGKALSSDITLSASDVAALPASTSIPSKTSDLTNDSGFITGYTETDPVFAASAAHGISSSDIANWNSKQAALVSGTNIKTVNGESILGSGDIPIDDLLNSLDSGATGTLTLYNCTGTVSNNTLAFLKSKGGEIWLQGRVNINNFVRTGGNCGVEIDLPSNVPTPTITATFSVGFRAQNPRENLYIVFNSGSRTALLQTNETFQNAQNGTLTFICSGRIFVK